MSCFFVLAFSAPFQACIGNTDCTTHLTIIIIFCIICIVMLMLTYYVLRSLEVKVEDLTTKQSGVKKSENYHYAVKRLPDDVVKEGCRFAVS